MSTEEKQPRDAGRKRKGKTPAQKPEARQQPIEPETATDRLRREIHEQQMADYGQVEYGGRPPAEAWLLK